MAKKSAFIETAIDEVLRDEGFMKKSRSWHKLCDETVFLVDLQKSNWGEQYYVNLGVLLRGLRDIPRPKLLECHVRDRLESLTASNVELCKALDLEDKSITDKERADLIKRIIKESGLPFLKRWDSVEKFRERILRGDTDMAVVRPEVRERYGAK